MVYLYIESVVRAKLTHYFSFLPETTLLWSICSGRELPCSVGVMEAGSMAHSNHPGQVSSPGLYSPPSCSSCLLHMLHCTARRKKKSHWRDGGADRGGALLCFRQHRQWLLRLQPACSASHMATNGHYVLCQGLHKQMKVSIMCQW